MLQQVIYRYISTAGAVLTLYLTINFYLKLTLLLLGLAQPLAGDRKAGWGGLYPEWL
jgi:hypothetical protein